MDIDLIVIPLAILGMRILGLSLATFRTLLMVRGQKVRATVLSLVEFSTYAFSLGWVVQDLSNPWNLLAYAGGSAAGVYLGMVIEARYVIGFSVVDVVSPLKAHEIAEAVRGAGFGATEGVGQGADGHVGTIRVVVRRQEIPSVLKAINSVDHQAFITIEEARALRSGWLRGR